MIVNIGMNTHALLTFVHLSTYLECRFSNSLL